MLEPTNHCAFDVPTFGFRVVHRDSLTWPDLWQVMGMLVVVQSFFGFVPLPSLLSLFDCLLVDFGKGIPVHWYPVLHLVAKQFLGWGQTILDAWSISILQQSSAQFVGIQGFVPDGSRNYIFHGFHCCLCSAVGLWVPG